MKRYEIQFINQNGNIEDKEKYNSINCAVVEFNKLLTDKAFNKYMTIKNIYYQLVEKENGKEDQLITSNLIKPYLD